MALACEHAPDKEKGTLKPRLFPTVADAEPIVTLADAIGAHGPDVAMVSDFDETDPAGVPSFCFHVGDVVYSFGESQYYYDQFYEPCRDYPAPIFAIAGNHDGMVAPNTSTPTIFGYMRLIVDTKQLRIEYHPATDGANAKTADDSVTVDLATRTLAVYKP